MSDDYCELTGSVVIGTTPRAVLVRLDDMNQVWIPRSVCQDGDSLEEQDKNVSVQPWWAEREDLA